MATYWFLSAFLAEDQRFVGEQERAVELYKLGVEEGACSHATVNASPSTKVARGAGRVGAFTAK